MYQEDTQPEVGRRIAHLLACDLWSLILHDDADPEAGAMGLARLAWAATPDAHPGGQVLVWSVIRSRILPRDGVTFSSVRLIPSYPERVWAPDPIPGYGGDAHVPSLATATNAAHAIGLVAQHLGLLERVEVTP